MQIDAFVDGMEDLGDLGPGAPLPPPLPPKRASKAMWIVGVIVVLLAAGLGIGAGWFILAGETAPVAPAAVPAPAPAPPPAAPEAAPEVMQLDEVVFDSDEPAAPTP
jgi:hypothetical protein